MVKKETKKIIVIGDVMVDVYTEGDVKKISPEAPVPILEANSITMSLGGAANVAKNLTCFGIDTYLVGYIGKDYAGEKFTEMIEKTGIKTKLLRSKLTTSKQRFGYPQMLRVDWEKRTTPREVDTSKIISFIKRTGPAIVIISDYAKGCISQSLFDEIVEISRRMKFKLMVDPKPKNNINYKGCFLMTPNLKEAIELCPFEGLEETGYGLMKKYKCNIIITRGKNGMDLFTKQERSHTPPTAKEVYNVSGAGDAVIASLAYAIANECPLDKAMNFANEIAGDAVSSKSTSIQVDDSFLSKVGNLKDG